MEERLVIERDERGFEYMGLYTFDANVSYPQEVYMKQLGYVRVQGVRRAVSIVHRICLN
jgi:hypothetical protein